MRTPMKMEVSITLKNMCHNSTGLICTVMPFALHHFPFPEGSNIEYDGAKVGLNAITNHSIIYIVDLVNILIPGNAFGTGGA